MHICVAIGVLKNEKGDILLVKRERGNFPGFWALPGGKLENGEGVYEAAIREIYEETGLSTEVTAFLGTAAEIIHEQDKIISTMLFFCELKVLSGDLPESSDVAWFNIEGPDNHEIIVPSDFLFLKSFYLDKTHSYMKLDCTHQPDGTYTWDV